MDLGFKNTDYGKIAAYCESLDVPFALKETRIGEIVFERREEKNPCALCSNLKRGALHNLALELGSKKVALGPHADDLVETFLMSLLYEGRIQSFKAVDIVWTVKGNHGDSTIDLIAGAEIIMCGESRKNSRCEKQLPRGREHKTGRNEATGAGVTQKITEK